MKFHLNALGFESIVSRFRERRYRLGSFLSSQMTNKPAPAIPLKEIYLALEPHVLGPTKIRTFREDDKFRSFQY
jgi:hypothetical protein